MRKIARGGGGIVVHGGDSCPNESMNDLALWGE